MRNRVMKSICWMMILMLLFQWSGVSAIPEAQRHAEAKQEEIDRAVEKLERLFDALEDIAKEIPRDAFDPQAIVDKVGRDPIALFEWVRDNTYLVPYRGVLRGPIGVLMDRKGNSLDRALLLHQLLVRAGHVVRLATGDLDKSQCELLVNSDPKFSTTISRGLGEMGFQSRDALAGDLAKNSEPNIKTLGRS